VSDPTTTVQQQPIRQQGLIVRILTLPFRLIDVLCGSLLLSIAIECSGMFVVWPEQGWRQMRRSP
jgi:hypothetical protein